MTSAITSAIIPSRQQNSPFCQALTATDIKIIEFIARDAKTIVFISRTCTVMHHHMMVAHADSIKIITVDAMRNSFEAAYAKGIEEKPPSLMFHVLHQHRALIFSKFVLRYPLEYCLSKPHRLTSFFTPQRCLNIPFIPDLKDEAIYPVGTGYFNGADWGQLLPKFEAHNSSFLCSQDSIHRWAIMARFTERQEWNDSTRDCVFTIFQKSANNPFNWQCTTSGCYTVEAPNFELGNFLLGNRIWGDGAHTYTLWKPKGSKVTQ